jgi:hypothetical protein
LANQVKETPVGYNRVYVRLGTEQINYPGFPQALKLGKSFSTNGPILDFEADKRYAPGDRVDIRRGQELRFRARARSLGALENLQLIVSGEVVAQKSGQAERELTLEKADRFDQSSWAAVRVFERSDRSESLRTRVQFTSSSNGSPWSCRSRCGISCGRSISSSHSRAPELQLLSCHCAARPVSVAVYGYNIIPPVKS